MPMEPGPGDAARGQHELLEPGLMPRCPVHLLIGLDERLDEHLAVAPVLELVLQGELERPDRRRVGDRRGVVEVVRVRGDLVGDEHPVDADELLDREVGGLGLGHRVDERDELVVRGHGQPVRVHLAQLGQALVPQLGMPRVVVAVGAETHLHVELGHGGDPAAQRLEELHLDPLVVADSPSGVLHVERARNLPAVPRSEWCPRLVRIGHGRQSPRMRAASGRAESSPDRAVKTGPSSAITAATRIRTAPSAAPAVNRSSSTR